MTDLARLRLELRARIEASRVDAHYRGDAWDVADVLEAIWPTVLEAVGAILRARAGPRVTGASPPVLGAAGPHSASQH